MKLPAEFWRAGGGSSVPVPASGVVLHSGFYRR